MVSKFDNVFVLTTLHTTYAFRVMDTGHLEHLYYGRRITLTRSSDVECLTEKCAYAPGNTSTYDGEHNSLSMENICLEMPLEWGMWKTSCKYISYISYFSTRHLQFCRIHQPIDSGFEM